MSPPPGVSRHVINEHGHAVAMSCWIDTEGVHIRALATGSQVEHVWTLAEAQVLREMLDAVLASPAVD